MADDRSTEPAYKVVVNEQEQYSIWPLHRESPRGWREVGVEGSREDCLAHIEKVWTDMRPRTLRERMSVRQESKSD
jgi:MbtH protein